MPDRGELYARSAPAHTAGAETVSTSLAERELAGRSAMIARTQTRKLAATPNRIVDTATYQLTPRSTLPEAPYNTTYLRLLRAAVCIKRQGGVTRGQPSGESTDASHPSIAVIARYRHSNASSWLSREDEER